MTKTVLIADDNPLIRRAVISTIRQIGGTDYVIKAEADNGVDAVQSFQEHLPDIVLMDLEMPGKDGIECLQEMLKIKPNARIAIISATLDSDRLVDAVALGATATLAKTDLTADSLSEILTQLEP